MKMNIKDFDGRSQGSRVVFLKGGGSRRGEMRVLGVFTGIAFLLAVQGTSLAQEAPAESDDVQAQAAEQAAPTDQDGAQQLLDEGQLDQLVAPIALYPDPLLAQVLIASTYPLEVVQAERWVEKNKNLKGDALDEAVAKEDWDDSIKALVEVPNVLEMMNEDLDWTSNLGDAVLAQQSEVMDAVQRLRALAQENGKLESNDQQTVTVKQEVNVTPAPAGQPAAQQPAPQQVIVIEPTSPETVYVPYYEPSVVYGSWPYPDYPPYYFEPRPGYIFGGALATGLAWSAGFAIGNAIWGDGFDWRGDNIRVNANRNVNINNNNVNVSNWQHNSYHRRGVNYNNTEVRKKFSKSDLADKTGDFRGRGDGLGNKRPDLGGKRPDVGDIEAGLKNKPNLGDKRPAGGGLGDKKPDLGNKRPSAGYLQGALKDKKPGGGGLADKKPDLKKPDLAKKPDIKKPDLAKKPNIKKPVVGKAAGNAFDKRDGAKAKDFSNRGKASVGNRSASNLAKKKPTVKKPAAKKPAIKKPAAKKPAVKKPAAKRPAVKRPSGGGGKRKGGGGGGKRRR